MVQLDSIKRLKLFRDENLLVLEIDVEFICSGDDVECGKRTFLLSFSCKIVVVVVIGVSRDANDVRVNIDSRFSSFVCTQ